MVYSCSQEGGRDDMVQAIIKDHFFLQIPSTPAGVEDIQVGIDLVETLQYHKDSCVGLAANMIGISKRIIAFVHEGDYVLMFNPKLVKGSSPYQTEESCLSLEGVRPTKRFQSIKVEYQTDTFQTRYKTYTDWTAQIIQHELDHCDGILI